MRALTAFLVTCAVLGTVQAYMWFDHTLPRNEPLETPVVVSGSSRIRLTLTFEARGDSYSTESLTVSLHGKRLLARRDPIPAGSVIELADVAGWRPGRNELYVRAVGRGGDLSPLHAVHVEVFHDGIRLADAALWARPGEPAEGPIRFSLWEAQHDHGD